MHGTGSLPPAPAPRRAGGRAALAGAAALAVALAAASAAAAAGGWDGQGPHAGPPASPLVPPALATHGNAHSLAESEDVCGGPHRITGPNRVTLKFNEPWYVYPNDGRYRDIHIAGEPPASKYQSYSRGLPLEGWCAAEAGHYIPRCPSEYVSVVFRGDPVPKDATGWMKLHRDQFNSFYSCSNWEPDRGSLATAVFLHDGQAPEYLSGRGSYLDLDRGYIHLAFDEPIRASSVYPGNLTVGYIYRYWQTDQITLGGATVASGNEKYVRLNLTSAQIGDLTRILMGSPYVAQFGDSIPREIYGDSRSGVYATPHREFAADMAGNGVRDHVLRHPIVLKPDFTAPALAGPAVLDMAARTLVLAFDSPMDAARTGDLSGVAIRGPGGAEVGLAGAAPPEAGGWALNVTLTPGQVEAVAAMMAAGRIPTGIVVPGGVFFDHAGNALAGTGGGGAALSVRPDAAPPVLNATEAHSLHLASGRMSLWLNETVSVRSAAPERMQVRSALQGAEGLDVGLRGAAVGLGEGEGAAVVTLTPAQRIEVAEYHKSPPAGGAHLQVHLGAGALSDPSGNAVRDATAALEIDPLGVPPLLRAGAGAGAAAPALSLSSGVLSLSFDSAVDIAGADASALAIRYGGAGAGAIALGGAAVSAAGDGAPHGIEVALARAQRDAAVVAGASRGNALLLDVEEGAFRGALRGNAYPGVTGLPLSVAPDADPPAPAAGVRPSLDAGSRKLTVVFDETVDASTANASLFHVEGRNGEGRMSLRGAAVSTADSTALVLTLTGAQDAEAIKAHRDGGGLRIDVGAGAVLDLAGNPAVESLGLEMDTRPDRGRPHLAGAPVIDLAGGLLTVRLHEYADVSEVHPRLMKFTWWGRGVIPLSGSQVVTADDGPAFTIRLTAVQHDQVARNIHRGLTLTIGDGAVVDLSGNRIARAGTNGFSFVNASTSPGMAGPPAVHTLNMSSGTATFLFNETMDASLTDPSLVNITVPGAAPVPLGGAEARSLFYGGWCAGGIFEHTVYLGLGINRECGTDAVALALTAGQMAALSHALAASGEDGGGALAARADIAAGAFSDTLGHPMAAGASGVPVAVEADALGPSRNGTLRNEHRIVFYPSGVIGSPLWSLERYNAFHAIEPAAPVLNMSDGTLTFALNEHASASSTDPSRVSVANRTGGSAVALGRAAGPPADTDLVALRLDAGQRAAISGLAASQGPVTVDAAEGAFADLWGNPSPAMRGLAPVYVGDAAGPAPDPLNPPALDLSDGTLSVWLDEYIDGQATVPSRAALVVAADGVGDVRLRLGGAASPPASSGDHAPLALTAAQKAAVVRAAENLTGAVALDAEAGAFSDAAGNPSPPVRGLAVAVAADTRAPALGGASLAPLLNLSAGTVAFSFDEHVNASATNPQAVSLANLTGGDRVRLGGAAVAEDEEATATSGTVTLRLTPGQVGAAARLAAAGDDGGQLRIDASEGAFADLSGNAFAGASNLTVRPAPDAEPPRLLSGADGAHRLDLGGARLALAFNEYIDAPAVSASGIALATQGGAGPGALNGASVEQALPGATVSVRLTAEQASEAAWAHRHSPDPLLATVTAGAGVADLAGNALAGEPSAAPSVVEGEAGSDGPLIGPHYYVQVREYGLDADNANRSAGQPGHVAVGPGGIYATDGADGRIDVIGRGEGAARSAISGGALASVDQVAVLPDGTVVARMPAGAAGGTLVVVEPDGATTRTLRAGTGPSDDPLAIAAGPDGRLVVGSEDGRVRVLDVATGASLLEFGGAGLGGAEQGAAFTNITAVAAGGPGGRIAVADGTSSRVQLYHGNGTFLAAVGNASQPAGAGEGQFDGPLGAAIGPGGRVFVADTGNARIQAFEPDGSFAAAFSPLPAGGGSPTAGIAAGPGSRLFVADARGGDRGAVLELERFDPPDVRSLDPDGAYGEGRTVRIAAEFDVPVRIEAANASIALDAGGQEAGSGPAAAWYRAGNNTRTLEFVYHVGGGHSSADLSALSLAASGEGGRIAAGGQEVPGMLAGAGEPRSLALNSDIVVETEAPAVVRVEAGVPDGFYGRGAAIPISVLFSEPVSAATRLNLALATGPGGAATTVRSNGTAPGEYASRLNFTYTVGAGDDADRLNYSSSGSLAAANPHEVSDRAGNEAGLALPEPGEAGSLSARHALQVVGSVVHAAVASAEITGPNEITVEYTAALDASSAAYGNLTILPSGGQPQVTGVSGSGTAVHTVSFGSPAAGPEDTATIGVSALRGNNLHHSFPGAAALPVADGQRPAILSAEATAPDRIRVRFTEHVSANATDPGATWMLSGPDAAGLSVSSSPAIDGADFTVLGLSGPIAATAPNVSVSYSAGAGDVADAAGDPMEDEGPVAVADALPPLFKAEATAPNRIAVAFSEPVTATATDPAATWVLSGPDAAGLSVSSSPAIEGSNRTVLGLSGPIAATAPNVSVSYSAGAGDVADAAGNRMAHAGPERAADALPPRFGAAAIAPGSIAVTFSEPIDATGGSPSATWVLSGPDSAGLSVSAAPAVHGARSAILGLSGNVSGTAPGLSLSYSAGAGDVADAAGNRMLYGGPERAADALPPRFGAAAIAPGSIAVTFSEPVTATATDPAATWVLSGPDAAGLSVSSSPAIDNADRTVLGLSGNVSGTAPGLTLSYSAGAGDAADAAGNRPIPAGEPPGRPGGAAAVVADRLAPMVAYSAITGPRQATVEYTEPVEAGQAAYRSVAVGAGAARPVTGLSGGGTAEHTVTFGGAAAAPGSTGLATINATAVLDGALPSPNALGASDSLGVPLSDGQAPHIVSAAVTGPRSATVLYDRAATAAAPGDAQPAYLSLRVDGAARQITGHSGLGGSDAHVLEFGGAAAGTGAAGTLAVDARRVAGGDGSGSRLGPEARLEVALSDGQAPRVLSASLSGPGRATILYSEPVAAAPSSYANLTVGEEARPVTGLSGSGTAEHAVSFGGERPAPDSTGSVLVNASGVLDLAAPAPNALGDGPEAVRLGDGLAPTIVEALVTGPLEATVRYAEPVTAAPGAYTSAVVGGEGREIAGSRGLDGSDTHVLAFGGEPAGTGAAGAIRVDPSLIADGSGNVLGTGAPFGHGLDDGQAPSILSAAVTGPNRAAVRYSEPAWAELSSYANLTVGGEARPVTGLSGSGTAEHAVSFGGAAATAAGGGGTVWVNATEVHDLALPSFNALGSSALLVALEYAAGGAGGAGGTGGTGGTGGGGGVIANRTAATAEAAFTAPNKVRIEYSAPLGAPARHSGPVYGAVSIDGGQEEEEEAGAPPVPGGVSGVGTAVHTVRFGGSGAGANHTGSIALNADLEGISGGALHVFTDDAIPVMAGESVRTLATSALSPVVEIERDGFVRGVDAAGSGSDGARPAINVSGLAAAGGDGGGTVRFPADAGGVRIAAPFAEVVFPPNVTAMSVPAGGVIELYVHEPGSLLGRVAASLNASTASLELRRIIEIGGGPPITFDMPVRILLAGQAYGTAFYVDGADGTAVPITTACAADDTAAVHAQLGGSGECQLDSWGDKIIHTYHLTLFGTARERTALESALERTPAGGTLLVERGTYAADILVVDRPVTVAPADPADPPLFAGHSHIVVRPSADGPITITGLSFAGTSHAAGEGGLAAVRVEAAHGSEGGMPVRVLNNTFDGTCWVAVAAAAGPGAPPIAGLSVSGNMFYGIGANAEACPPPQPPGARADAIALGRHAPAGGPPQLVGLEVRDNYVFGAADAGIRIAGASGAAVEGNHVEGAGDDGIRILPSSKVAVRGNTIIDANGAPHTGAAHDGAAGAAIEVWAGSDDVAVSLNRISGSAGALSVCAGACDPGADPAGGRDGGPVEVARAPLGSADGANDVRFNHNVLAASNGAPLVSSGAGGALNARSNYYPGHAEAAGAGSGMRAAEGGRIDYLPALGGDGPVRVGVVAADAPGSPVRSIDAAAAAGFAAGAADYNAAQGPAGGRVGIEPVAVSVRSPDAADAADHAAALESLRTGASGDARMRPVLENAIGGAIALYDGGGGNGAEGGGLAAISAMESGRGHYPFVTARNGTIVAHGADPSLVGRADIVAGLAGGPDGLRALYDFGDGTASTGIRGHPNASWKWWAYEFASPAAGGGGGGEAQPKRSMIVLHAGADGAEGTGDDLVFGAGYYPPGPPSHLVVAAGDAAAAADRTGGSGVVVSPTSTETLRLAAAGDMLFRLAPPDAAAAEVIAGMLGGGGAGGVVVLSDGASLESRSMAAAVASAAAAAGAGPVEVVSYDSSAGEGWAGPAMERIGAAAAGGGEAGAAAGAAAAVVYTGRAGAYAELAGAEGAAEGAAAGARWYAAGGLARAELGSPAPDLARRTGLTVLSQHAAPSAAADAGLAAAGISLDASTRGPAYAAYDAAFLLGRSIAAAGTAAAGAPPSAVAGMMAEAARGHAGSALGGRLILDANGDLALPAGYAVSRVADDGSWAAVGGPREGPGACSMGLETGTVDLGAAQPGGRSQAAPQTIVNTGTRGYEGGVDVSAGEWQYAGGRAGGPLGPGLTAYSAAAGGGYEAAGPEAARLPGSDLGPGEEITVRFVLDLTSMPALAAGPVSQTITYSAECR